VDELPPAEEGRDDAPPDDGSMTLEDARELAGLLRDELSVRDETSVDPEDTLPPEDCAGPLEAVLSNASVQRSSRQMWPPAQSELSAQASGSSS